LDILATKNSVKKLQNCTSSGLQTITAELIKHGTEKSFEMLDTFERCIYRGNVPDDLKTAYVMPMYKEGITE
jgi:hypothetical protein